MLARALHTSIYKFELRKKKCKKKSKFVLIFDYLWFVIC